RRSPACRAASSPWPGRRAVQRPRRSLPGARGWSAGRSVPIQCLLLPGVEEADDEDPDEDDHLAEPEPTELAEEHRPRKEEDHLDVEDHEEQGEDVEVRGVTAPGLPHRLLSG